MASDATRAAGSDIGRSRARRRAARRARIRRRRIVALAVVGGGIAALATVLGGRDGPAPAERPLAAGPLEPRLLVGQRLVAGWKGERPPRGLRGLIRSGGLAGVVLFAGNAPSRRRARASIRRLQGLPRPTAVDRPLLVMVDQEGGRASRLGGPPAASAKRMGSRGRAYAFAQGRATAASLTGLGINVELAPVLDLARPGGAIARERRGFAAGAERVIEVGVEGFAAGLAAGGVATTAKHFPGIGAVATSTDLAGQRVSLELERLRAADERPFSAFIDGGGDLVMLSLATYPALADRPAALSRRAATTELRDRLGFEGVSITDALDAAAAESFGGTAEVALAATRAGSDLLLYPDWRRARRVGRLLRRRLRAGSIDPVEAERAADRVQALRSELAGPEE
jgi:beta-N-acetylhexosaminidase